MGALVKREISLLYAYILIYGFRQTALLYPTEENKKTITEQQQSRAVDNDGIQDSLYIHVYFD